MSGFNIPQIPAGAQLGGAGTEANQAQAGNVPQYQAPVVQEPVQTPQTPQTPQSPLAPAANPFQQPIQQPVQQPIQPVAPVVPTAPVQEQANPYKQAYTHAQSLQGASYVETSVNHLAAELNLNPDVFVDVIGNAVTYNDPNLINLAVLGTLTPEQTFRAGQLARAAFQEAQVQVQQQHSEIYTVAGGEAQWNTAVQAFNANAPQEVQEYVAFLANSERGKQAAEQVMNYVRGNGLQNHVQQAPLQGGVGTPASGLSRQEYMDEIGKLEREAGNRSLASGEYAALMADLDQRRTIGRSQGR